MAGYGSGLYGSGLYGTGITLDVEVRSSFPPRIHLAASGLTVGDTVTIARRAAGDSTAYPVRGSVDTDGNPVVVTSDALTCTDSEFPFGKDLTYTLTDGTATLTAVVLASAIPEDQVILSDAISGQAAQVIVSAWPDKTRTRASSVFTVNGRNVVVNGKRTQFTSTLEVYTDTETARQSLDDLLASATQGILQLRQPGGYSDVDCYVSVQSDTCSRWSGDGNDEQRLWSLDVVELDAWPWSQVTSDFTLQDIADTYTGQTLADLAGDFATLLAIDEADWS